jgi:DNA-3-methyladenine glycosylase II
MHRRAIAHLRSVDPVLARVIERVGDCRIDPPATMPYFAALSRAIVYQQLSGKAAATIYRRFEELFGGRSPTPDELLATPDDRLRAVGLSRQKTAYLKDLAARAHAGEVPIDRLHELEDREVIAALVRVKGVGRWTAQMFLMFRLGRPDVLPDLDLGIQSAIQRAYGLSERPTPARVLEIGERWSPYCTVASWYLWRLLDVGKAEAPVERVGAAKKSAAKAAAKRGAKAPAKRATKRAAKRARKSGETSAAKTRAPRSR